MMISIKHTNLSRGARSLLVSATTPRTQAERRSGVDGDVAAARIMLAPGTKADRDAALAALATAFRKHISVIAISHRSPTTMTAVSYPRAGHTRTHRRSSVARLLHWAEA